MADQEPKKLALIRIMQILERESDVDHPLKQEDIARILQRDYGIELERKAVGRNLALLEEAGAGFKDIGMAVVYLRDQADYPLVKSILSERLPSLNVLYVHGPVCRPGWLVEMECIALTPEGSKAYPNF